MNALNKISNSEHIDKVCIATLLKYPEKIDEVLKILSSKHFVNSQCASAYQIIVDSYINTGGFERFSVSSQLLTSCDFFKNYSVSGVIDWFMGSLNLYDVNLAVLAETIANRYMTNFFVKTLNNSLIDARAINKQNDIWKIIFDLQKQLDNIEIVEQKAEKIKDLLKKYIDIPPSAFVVDSGFKKLSRYLGKIRSGNLMTIGARPSMGKTSFALNMALKICKQFYDIAVLFISMEMSSMEIVERVILSETSVSLDEARSKKSSKAIKVLSEKLGTYSTLLIDDSPSWNIINLRSYLFCLSKKTNLRVVFIDYLQLLKSTSKREKHEQISEITKECKRIAKSLNIVIILLSQVSRSVDSRDVKVPQLSDLKESGSIEEDSDIVVLINRAEYYLSRVKPRNENSQEYHRWKISYEKCKGKADIIVAKNRNGDIGQEELVFTADKCLFS